MQKRWQDWVMLVFGLWLFLAPFILQYSGSGRAAWNSYILGLAVIVFAASALARPQLWGEWINLVIGVWLVISPFVLNFESQSAATWNHLILGVLIAGDALWAIVRSPTQQLAQK